MMWWTEKGLSDEWCAAAECHLIREDTATRVYVWVLVEDVPLPAGWRLSAARESPSGCLMLTLDYIEGYHGQP